MKIQIALENRIGEIVQYVINQTLEMFRSIHHGGNLPIVQAGQNTQHCVGRDDVNGH